MTERSLKLLDVVALTDAIPSAGLPRGQVGTVVELLDAETCEVEFADTNGRAYAIVPVAVSKLMRLQYEPLAAAGQPA